MQTKTMNDDLKSGFPLWVQQFKALLRKNSLLSWRSKGATFSQLFVSLLFVLIIFLMRKSEEAKASSSTAYDQTLDPRGSVSPPVPPCEDKAWFKKPCFDFVWSGNDSSTIRAVVESIMKNNPGRPIPPKKVKSFRTKAEVEEWLYSNPMHCSGALHFVERNSTVISYGIQVNSTSARKRGQHEDSGFKFLIPLQIAAEREITRSLIRDPKFSWTVSLKEFAHPAVRVPSMLESQASPAFLASALFGFVLQMSSLVEEKELKLRQAMAIMGLYDSAYWLSWLVWEGFLTIISSLLLVLFGLMFQIEFFLRTSFLDLFLTFSLFQLNMLGLAFLLSTFFSNSTSSVMAGFSMFIIGVLTQVATNLNYIYSYNIPKIYQIVWSFFPPNLLTKVLSLLMEASSTNEEFFFFDRPSKCPPNNPGCTIITVSEIYVWLASTFVLWIALAVYFDNIISNGSGVRRSAFYFLKPGYWTGKSTGNRMNGDCGCMSSGSSQERVPATTFRVIGDQRYFSPARGFWSPMSIGDQTGNNNNRIVDPPDDQDVLEEETLLKQQAIEGLDDPTIAVQIRGLEKTYPATTKIIGCLKCKKNPPHHALKGLWINIRKDQLFCLLGHNGAGKSTAINCLTGITTVTGGDALIYGHSILSSFGMSKIRKLIGVCPQFDTLWDSLSGQEHLNLFASIKGLPPASIPSATETLLEKVRLTGAARVRAGSYSGGMRRRLSVAIAFIGDPKLVVLDEPTTGMDPITRRHVWDIIEEAKKGRAIVLTTHSMEEADILSDRIGIMAKGRLRCIGTSIRLKTQFGAGFIANVSFDCSSNGQTPDQQDFADDRDQEAVKHFFKDGLDVVPKEENKSFLTFVIPPDREVLLTKFFEELQERQEEFGIADIQLGLTTLEEVFLNISRQAELETAMVEGRSTTLTLTSGLSIEIPLGARFVGVQGSESEENPRGVMVEVYWDQDESGFLCISGHSDEIPIPLGIGPMPSLDANYSKVKPGLVHGVLIDPNQINTSDSMN